MLKKMNVKVWMRSDWNEMRKLEMMMGLSRTTDFLMTFPFVGAASLEW